jgi:hypothetical protein
MKPFQHRKWRNCSLSIEAWLDTLSTGIARDYALQAYATHPTHEKQRGRDKALQWAEKISDPALRAKTLERLKSGERQ